MKVSSGHRRPVCSCAAFGDVRPHHSQPHVTASIKTGHRSFFSIRPPHVRTRQHHPPCVVTRPRPRAASLIRRAGGLSLLGQDVLYFLGATVAVIPVFKKLNISPVLGFLASGVLLHQLGLTKDIEDLEKLSELGVLFLLFEMGLELSLDRLKALAKYAFGMGTLQVIGCTGIFALCALPVGQGLATQVLEVVAGAPHNLVSLRTIDEAVVIGGALSMSSSAFVLQLLKERGEMATRFGSATLGVLLLQDIAVVPFLVLLPLIELDSAGIMQDSDAINLVTDLGPTVLKTLGGLGLLLVGGRVVLRRVFEVVAQSRNTEAFLALCLLTVAGASYTTSSMGFSDTMGAFIAGVLLSETNYKTQVEADIKPFRGLLLGLFFTTTGGSINLDVLQHNWLVISWILAGLLATKTAVIATLGKQFGLTTGESLRIGFMLSQGGEFAFVLLSLAAQLKVLPENLNQVLIIVVVLSMALTPGLAELGKISGDWLEGFLAKQQASEQPIVDVLAAEATSSSSSSQVKDGHQMVDPIVICGFGPQGQMLANLLESPLVPSSYIAFDTDVGRVQAGRQAGFPVIFGDASRRAVLEAAGADCPRAFLVSHRLRDQALHTVELLHATYPTTPIYACGVDLMHAAELERAGATATVVTTAQAGVTLACRMLVGELGMAMTDVEFIKENVEQAMVARTREILRDGPGDQEKRSILVLDTVRHENQASTDSISVFSSDTDESSFDAVSTASLDLGGLGESLPRQAWQEHDDAVRSNSPDAIIQVVSSSKPSS